MSALLLLIASASAQRPTQGGLWSYDSTDVLEFYDSEGGRVRVHYSVAGSNQATDRDSDSSGVPDIVEDTAEIAEAALIRFEELGFRAPLSEADLGLGELGGSPAFDFYLVDFNGGSDGSFQLDDCFDVPRVCSGHMLVENDFSGSGYTSVRAGIDTVVPHELFHAVQAAYEAEMEPWLSEGTATWAERRWDDGSSDYMRLVDAYLEDTQRPIYQSPSGPASGWSYGTAIWFDYVGLVSGDEVWVISLLEGLERQDSEAVDAVPVMLSVLDELGLELGELWQEFSEWNLATGKRSGALQGYPYAKRVGPIEAESERQALVDDDQRFQPMATTYWHIDHGGGELHFVIEESTPALAFGLHAVQDVQSDGVVEPALMTWRGETQSLGELPAGGYWLWGSYDAMADASIKVRVCLGGAQDVADCGPLHMGDTGDDTGLEPDPDPEGCGGCAGGGGLGGLWLLSGLLLMRRRR